MPVWKQVYFLFNKEIGNKEWMFLCRQKYRILRKHKLQFLVVQRGNYYRGKSLNRTKKLFFDNIIIISLIYLARHFSLGNSVNFQGFKTIKMLNINLNFNNICNVHCSYNYSIFFDTFRKLLQLNIQIFSGFSE
jgi:hypothetical protein